MRRLYSMEERGKAIALSQDIGLSKAARQMKIPKTTIAGWARELDEPLTTEVAASKMDNATKMSVLARREMIEQSNERMTRLLVAIANLAARAEIEFIQQGKASLSELVGARTRALHDLALLNGAATERHEVVDTTESIIDMRDELRKRLGA